VITHWIDKSELKSVIILTEKLIDGPHIGIDLASDLAKVLQTFGIIQSIFCITANH